MFGRRFLAGHGQGRLSGGAALSSAAQWFADSEGGSDSNDGTSEAQAVETISALQALDIQAGDTISLARGSHWREQLGRGGTFGTVLPNGVTVQAYGTGERPILDAFDAVSAGAWSKTGGRTNVYQFTHTPEHDPDGGGQFMVLEDDVGLRGVDDLATCDSTAGSMVITPPAEAGSYTIYIHASDSGNPAANGKAYEVTSRFAGVIVENGSSVFSVHTKGNINNNGSLSIGVNGYAYDCLMEWGHRHNAIGNRGSHFEACIALYWRRLGSGGTAYVIFDDADEGFAYGAVGGRATDCYAIGWPLATPTTDANMGGFYAHTSESSDEGTSKGFRSVIYERCHAAYCSGSAFSMEVIDAVYRDCSYYKCTGALFAGSKSLTVQGCRLYGHADGDDTWDAIRLIAGAPSGAYLVEDSILTAARVSGGMIFGGGTSPVVRRCIIAGRDRLGFTAGIDENPNSSWTGGLTSEDNLFDFESTGDAVYYNEGGVIASLDRNVWSPASVLARYGGSNYGNLAAFQAVFTTAELNSITGTATFETEADSRFPIYDQAAGSPTAAVAAGPSSVSQIPAAFVTLVEAAETAAGV